MSDIDPSDLISSLDEMERSTSASLRAQRASTRHIIHCELTVRPGNVSQRAAWELKGVSSDISSNGSKVLLEQPMMVGDLFHVTFDRKALNVPPVYARCMRCRLLNENAYEIGLKFLTPVEIVPAHDHDHEETDLI